ncbi:MAG: ribosome-recycling factor [Planctomycetota bacterium]|jgi:ribosome recycling factor
MPVKDIVSQNKQKMNKTVEVFHDELKSVRTGKASTALVENLKVEYYGTPTPLKQLATLAAPQVDTIVIKPFDPASVKDIEKRLSLPALSGERRTQLVNQAKHMGEQAKVTIRNIRRDANKHLEKEEKDKVITEDDLEKGKKQIDDTTRECTDKIDGMVKAKADEITLE